MIQEPHIIRSRQRRRTVALHVEPDGQLVVHAPIRTSLRWIQAFIQEKAAWIAKRRAEIGRASQNLRPTFQNGDQIPFRGGKLTLCLQEQHALIAPASLFDPQTDTLFISLSGSLSPAEKQAETQTEILLWGKKWARVLFQERLSVWAEKTGLFPARLIVTDARKRWGSCNAAGEIRLNWRLIQTDPDVLDYVIVHELCHIPYKNHSKRFWALVERHIPDVRARRRKLRAFEKQYPLDKMPQSYEEIC